MPFVCMAEKKFCKWRRITYSHHSSSISNSKNNLLLSMLDIDLSRRAWSSQCAGLVFVLFHDFMGWVG